MDSEKVLGANQHYYFIDFMLFALESFRDISLKLFMNIAITIMMNIALLMCFCGRWFTVGIQLTQASNLPGKTSWEYSYRCRIINKMISTNCMGAICDTFILLPCSICFLMPTLWNCIYKGIHEMTNNTPIIQTGDTLSMSVINWNSWYVNLRIFFIIQFRHTLQDLLSGFLCIFGFLSPLRHKPLLEAIKKSHNDRKVILEEISSSTSNEIDIEIHMYTNPLGEEFEYNSEIRMHCMYYGALAITDVFLLPLLLPLLITWYRFKSISKSLFQSSPSSSSSSRQQWHWNEFALIISQFIWLMVSSQRLIG
eukprot:gene5562-11193_t